MTLGLSGPGVRAVLIGTGRHVPGSLLTDVPAVSATLRDLGRVLVEYCGLDEENLLVIEDSAGPAEVIAALDEASDSASETLLVVYVGHGQLAKKINKAGKIGKVDRELYLATSGTSTLGRASAIYTAIPYSAVAMAVDVHRDGSTVVVLDCCFSGRAELLSRRGYLLASVSDEQHGLAPDGATHTAFLGTMIDFLRDGDPDAPPNLTVNHLYTYQARVQTALGHPAPRPTIGDMSGKLVLTANRAYVPPKTDDGSSTGTGSSGGSEPARMDETCPYRGFGSYGAEHEAYFRGRAEVTNELVSRAARRLGERGPLIVIGPSGAGKTSLLHAGLLPAIGRGRLGVPRSGGWPRVSLSPGSTSPGSTPVRTLAVRVAAEVGCDADTVINHPERIAGLLRTPARQPDTRLVLVIDQFEQLFTQCEDESQRAAFVDLLTALAGGGRDERHESDHDQDGQPAAALVVLGVRADFYAHCAKFPKLAAALQDTVLVGPMSADELRTAIVEPAEYAGLKVDPDLVDTLLRDLGADRPNGFYDAGKLPLLSHALQRTWGERRDRVLTKKGYLSTGGIAHAVESSGERALEKFKGSASHGDCVRQVLLSMVRINEGAPDVVARVAVADLLNRLPDPEVGRSVLNTFAEERLVTVDRDSAVITHEALLNWWPQLRQWIDEDRDWLRMRQRIDADAGAWQQAERDNSLLYRGSNLANVREKTGWDGKEAAGSARRKDLGPAGRDFLAAGARHARRGLVLRRAVQGVIAVLVLSVAFAAVFAFKQLGVAHQQRNAADRQRTLANQQRDRAISRGLATRSEAIGNEQPDLSALLGVAAWRITPTQEARKAMLDSLDRQGVAAVETPLAPKAIAFASGGKNIVVAGSVLASSSASLPAVARADASSGALIGDVTKFAVEQGQTVQAEALSPDGSILAVDVRSNSLLAFGVGTLEAWDLATGKQLFGHEDGQSLPVTRLAFSPDGTMLASIGKDGVTVRVEDPRTGRLIRDVPFPLQPPRSVIALGAKGMLAVTTNDFIIPTGTTPGAAELLNVNSPASPRITIGSAAQQFNAMAFGTGASADSLATADQNGMVQIWNAVTGKSAGVPIAQVGVMMKSLAFSLDGKRLAGGGEDKSVYLWDLATGKQIGTPLVGQSGQVSAVVFSPDGGSLVSAGDDGSARLWRLSGRTPALALDGHTGAMNAVAFADQGKTLVGAGADGSDLRWDASNGKTTGGHKIDGPAHGSVTAVSRDGTMVAVDDGSGDVSLHEDQGDQSDFFLVPSGTPSGASTNAMAFSPDGKTLAVAEYCIPGACGDVDVHLWDTATGKQLGSLDRPSSALSTDMVAVAFSPDGSTIATTDYNGDLTWWSAITHQVLHTSRNSLVETFGRLEFSPDGKSVATVSGNSIEFFASDTGAVGTRLTAAAPVKSMAFSPDGSLLAVGMENGSVQLYSTVDYSPSGVPLKTGSLVESLAFDATGNKLAAGLDSGTAQVWDTSYALDPAAAICGTGGRTLSQAAWDANVPAGPVYRPVCPRSP